MFRQILRRAFVLASTFILFSADVSLAQEDPRKGLGTRSLDAALSFREGRRLLRENKIPAARDAFEKAYGFDREFSLAVYWSAISSADIGDIELAMETYEKAIEIGMADGVGSNIVVDAAINLGLLHTKVGDEEKAIHWFSRAILFDAEDFHKLAWKAYKNLAVSYHRRKDNLSAAITAISAFEASPENVGEEFVVKLMEMVDEADEVGTVLSFPARPAPPKARTASIQTRPLEVAGVDGEVVDLQLDPVQDRVFVFVKGAAHFYRIDGAEPAKAIKVETGAEIACGCANAGGLFLVLKDPSSLVRVDPLSGKVLRRWPLRTVPPSIAVYPIQEQAIFPARGVVNVLDLSTGELDKTEFMATGARVDPRQRFCFTYIHPGFGQGGGGHVIIGGRPVFLQPLTHQWRQTTLFRFAFGGGEVFGSQLRMNACSNGRVLHVSPDGRWVAVAGGGGWRPADPARGSGYGVAVFSADDLNHLQGFFETESHSNGVAINPVSGLVATFGKKVGRISDIAEPGNHVEFEGPFGLASTWDRRGLTLYVAAPEAGLVALQVGRSAEEKRRGDTWVAAMRSAWPEKPKGITVSSDAEVVAGFEGFEVSAEKPAIVAAIRRATREGKTETPLSYVDYAPYVSGAASRPVLIELSKLANSKEAGIAIFRIKKLLEKEPDHPGLHHLLGTGYYFTGQYAKAGEQQLRAIRLDKGRTSATGQALRGLAHSLKKRGAPVGGAYCYAHALLLDQANPTLAGEARGFFEVSGTLAEAGELLAVSAPLAAAAGPSKAIVEKLLRPEAGGKMEPADLFAYAVSSVVLVKSGEGSGSAVCIGEGVLLTNRHVVGGTRGDITVHPYALVEGKPLRLAALDATVLHIDRDRDLALLKVDGYPRSLKPLALALRNPAPGERVYAIGSPGLGREVLDQSITEGIVSAVDRAVGGAPFLQHTAAINPGNSGGPLLNAQGHVLGINTIKASLENVSFAIPAPAIRRLIE